MSKPEKKGGLFRHWPAFMLGLVVTLILILTIFTYQVGENDLAIVTTFGLIQPESPQPGLHFCWPYPVEKVYKFDKRARAFSGTTGGAAEEILTRDGKNIVVSIFIVYRISDGVTFFKTVSNLATAEQRLNDFMRSAKSTVFGRYDFDQLINTNPEKMKLGEVSGQLCDDIRPQAEKLGIAIERVGINSLNVPEKISKNIFERMKKERDVKVQELRSSGEREASRIVTDARKQSSMISSEAQARALRIRAEGDAEAAKYYSEFSKSPKLAAFLRSLEALRQILRTRTTLVLDTGAPPFDLLNPGALNALSVPSSAAAPESPVAVGPKPMVTPTAPPAGPFKTAK